MLGYRSSMHLHGSHLPYRGMLVTMGVCAVEGGRASQAQHKMRTGSVVCSGTAHLASSLTSSAVHCSRSWTVLRGCRRGLIRAVHRARITSTCLDPCTLHAHCGHAQGNANCVSQCRGMQCMGIIMARQPHRRCHFLPSTCAWCAEAPTQATTMLLHATSMLNPSCTLQRWHPPRASSNGPTNTPLPALITHQLRRARAALTAPLFRAAQRRRLTTLLQTQEGRAVCFEVPTFPLEPGDVVLICGDSEALGRWNPQV